MDTALEARLTRMEQEIAELRLENQSLRAVPEAKQDAKKGALLPRRALLTGAAYTLGAVGLSLVGTRPAKADLQPILLGGFNNSGAAYTSLKSTSPSSTLSISNDNTTAAAYALFVSNENGTGVYAVSNGTEHAVQAVKANSTGHCLLATHNHPFSSYGAIAGVTKGSGPGCYGRGEGSGNGLWGQIADAAKSQSAVLGTTEGAGAAIEGNSILGRGGVFKGKKAQIRLVASSATNKPSTGTRGDLFVDSTGRLWYCKTSGSATGWKQLA